MLLILQLFPAPQATSTRRGGIRWTKVDGGRASTQKIRAHWRYLVFLSCKEVGHLFHIEGTWTSTRGGG